jgi:hypothetical protein
MKRHKQSQQPLAQIQQRGIPLYALPSPFPEPPEPQPPEAALPTAWWCFFGALVVVLLAVPYAYNKGVERGTASSKERLSNQQQTIREQRSTIDAAKRALGCKE